MTSGVVAEIEAEVRQLRASGRVPPGLEDELDKCFEEAAEASLAARIPVTARDSWFTGGHSIGGLASPLRLAQIRKEATVMVRRRLGPSFRRLERRASLGVAWAGEAASIQAHVTADHLERLAARSPLVCRVLSAARPGESIASGAGIVHPSIEGPLLAWVLDRLSAAVPEQAREVPGLVLHAECGDGRLVEALVARGLDARGADPRWPARTNGGTRILAAGALEYLGATVNGTLDGLLLTGVVDRLRPGAARVLVRLAARSLAPGGVVVLVSARPEAAVATDPVASDLAAGRPLHPVTWCHLLARSGLCELAVFEHDESDPDVFAVSARRVVPALLAEEGRP